MRDYRLVVDGTYNRRAIMQMAWAYMRQNRSLKWYSLEHALKESWADASMKMDEYKALTSRVHTDRPKPANNLGQALMGLNSELRYYDSSWR